jgi:hypothetical protein
LWAIFAQKARSFFGLAFFHGNE